LKRSVFGPQAWTHFEAALEICPCDKPSKRLVLHMDSKANNPDYGLASIPFIAPEGWQGYHALLGK